jgi:hypothetical protein
MQNEWTLWSSSFVQKSILPQAKSHLYFVLNEPGSGMLEIPMDSYSASIVTTGMFAMASYRNAVRGGFLIDNITENLAGEGGERWMQLSGRGELALLEDAIVYPTGDGTISTRTFEDGMAKAMIQLIDEAKDRNCLQEVTYSFTATDDTDSVAWTDDDPFTVTVGASLLEVLRKIAELGIDFNMTYDSATEKFVLNAYKGGIGTNKSTTQYFRIGTNCEEAGSEERGSDLKNVMLLGWRDGATKVRDIVPGYRIREKYEDVRAAQSPAAVRTYGAAVLSTINTPKKSISIKVYDGVAPYLFTDYGLGDIVTVDFLGFEESHRILGIQCDWDGYTYSNVTLELNSLLDENEIKMAKDIEDLKNKFNSAHDSDLLAVSYWAAIGGKDDTISSVRVAYPVGTVVYFGGGFDRIGDVDAKDIAKYDTVTKKWYSLGDPPDSTEPAEDPTNEYPFGNYVTSIVNIGDYLYVGGQKNGLRRYNLNTGVWSVVGAGLSLSGSEYNAEVWALKANGTILYITGYFDEADGISANNIVKLDTSTDTYSALGGGLGNDGSAIGKCLEYLDGLLYAGGLFDEVDGSTPAFNVAYWNDTNWVAMGTTWENGIGSSTGTVYTLKAYGTNILAGTISAEAATVGLRPGGIWEWDTTTETWSVFENGLNEYSASGLYVFGIEVYLTDVYIVGLFTGRGNNVAKCSGGIWTKLRKGLNNTAVCAALLDDDLFVGGIYTEADEKDANKVAEYINSFKSLIDYINGTSTFDMAAAIHNAPASVITDADEMGFWEDVSAALRKITWANIKATIKTYADTLYVALTGNQTVAGVKTFSSFPVTPSEEPTTDYQVANKKYVDDNAGGGGSPGGSDTEIQYNDAGSFDGTVGMNWDKTNEVLNLGGANTETTGAEDTLNLIPKTDAQTVRMRLFTYSDTLAPYIYGLRATGTKAAKTALATAKTLFAFGGQGWDGSGWTGFVALVRFRTTEAWSTIAHGAEIAFFGTPRGSTTLTEFGNLDETGFNVPTGATYNINGVAHVHNQYIDPNANGNILLGNNFNIVDDGVALIALDNTADLFMYLVQMRAGSTSTNFCIGSCKAQATSVNASYVIGTNTVVTTGVLTGTTGTDGKLTISVNTDGYLYVENRTGATRNFTVKIW